MSQLPGPVRAALGVVGMAIDGAREFPEKAIQMPLLAVSSALQFSLRTQQRYTELTLRGDELLGRLRGLPEEPPEWATFDETPPDALQPPTAVAAPAASDADVAAALGRPEPATPLAERDRPSVPAKRTRRAAAKKPKTVPRPRTGKPSAFDAVADSAADLGPTAARAARGVDLGPAAAQAGDETDLDATLLDGALSADSHPAARGADQP